MKNTQRKSNLVDKVIMAYMSYVAAQNSRRIAREKWKKEGFTFKQLMLSVHRYKTESERICRECDHQLKELAYELAEIKKEDDEELGKLLRVSTA
jgi:hypothetical protein